VRVVDDAAQCRDSEVAITLNAQGAQGPAGPAGDGVKTIAGIVNADGSANGVTPAGFASQRLGPGNYQITFPAGTWSSFPVLAVTPFGVFGSIGTPVILSAVGFADGGSRFDNAFMFITAAAQAAP
jgi:hypothetical protein